MFRQRSHPGDAVAGPAARRHRYAGNPYWFLGRRPYREARLRSYLVSQHRRGRPLAEILDDAYVRRCGTEGFMWGVLQDPQTIEALEHDIREAIEDCRP
jgi:hypothetical protein